MNLRILLLTSVLALGAFHAQACVGGSVGVAMPTSLTLPEAEMVAEVEFMGVGPNAYKVEVAKQARVLTAYTGVEVGEVINIDYQVVGCGPFLKEGEKARIAGLRGTDEKDKDVFYLYSFHSGLGDTKVNAPRLPEEDKAAD